MFLGRVVVDSNDTVAFGAPYQAYVAAAAFGPVPQPSPYVSCTTQIGSCTFLDCMNPDAGADAGAMFVPAGSITIDVASKPSVSIAKTSNGDYRTEGQGALFSGGEMLTAIGGGESVPAFRISIQAPSRITVTQPTYPMTGAITIERTQPLVMKWTGGTNGTVGISVSTFPSGRVTGVSCSFDATAGTATIDTSLLAKLIPADGYLRVGCTTSTLVREGAWSIVFGAGNSPVAPDGRAIFIASATIR